jgi:hypothetical protein
MELNQARLNVTPANFRTAITSSRMTSGNGECALLITFIKFTLIFTDQMMAGLVRLLLTPVLHS